MSDLLKVRVGGSDYLCKWEEPGSYVKIGGRRYPAVKVGNQLWMAENLQYDIGNGHTGFYSTAEVNDDILPIIPTGWRLPYQADINALANYIHSDGYANESLALRSESGWTSGNGNDIYGFNAEPLGYWRDSYYADVGDAFMIRATYAPGYEIGKAHTWLTATDSYFNWYDGAGTSLDFGMNIRLVSFDYGKVTIGGRNYKTIKIGNQEWLAENLDYKFSGCDIGVAGTPSTPAAWYYNNDESTYGVNGNKYGLLYNWYSADYLNQHLSELGIPAGWHVPTTSEWDTLTTAVGGSSTAGTKLKSTTGWSSGNGDDSYGFAVFPAGGRGSDAFYNVGSSVNFWTTTEASSSGAFGRFFSTSASVSQGYANKTLAYPLRLVKDAT